MGPKPHPPPRCTSSQPGDTQGPSCPEVLGEENTVAGLALSPASASLFLGPGARCEGRGQRRGKSGPGC